MRSPEWLALGFALSGLAAPGGCFLTPLGTPAAFLSQSTLRTPAAVRTASKVSLSGLHLTRGLSRIRAPRRGRAPPPLALAMSGEDIGTWGVDDVAQWLCVEGFSEEWSAAFAQNEIDGEALRLLKVWFLRDGAQPCCPAGHHS